MRRVVPLLIVLSLGFAPAPVYKEEPESSEADLKALQGDWELDTRGLPNGRDAVSEGDMYIRKSTILTKFTKTYSLLRISRLDAKARPKEMDIGTMSPRLCIYKIEGDTLTIHYAIHRRPKGFDSDKELTWREVWTRTKP